MIDARVNVSIVTHPKTKKLKRKLGDSGPWGLICLFLWAAANRSDGKLTGMTAEDVELAVDWAGDDGAFVATLVAVGFLDGEDGSYAIHDWAEHNPWSAGAGARSEKAKWLALCKHHGRDKAAELMPAYAARLLSPASSTPAADDSMQDPENSSAPSPYPYPLPSPYPSTQPDSSADASESPPTGTRGKKPKTTFRVWLDSVRTSGERVISDYSPVWLYAENAGIPREWVELAWNRFRHRFLSDEKPSAKRYADWRRTFLNYVENNWLQLWHWSERDNSYCLSTTGVQALKAFEGQAGAQ